MGKIIPFWIEVWLIASTVICAADMAFTMLRPYTLKDGILGNVFFLWHIYADVDIRYGSTNDLTSMSTGRLMMVELIMNILAIFMDRKGSRHTLLTVFTSTVFVFWKTCIYLMMYIAPAPGNDSYIADGTTLLQYIFIFWVPNLFWIFVPLSVIVALWNRLAIPQPEKQLSQNKLVDSDQDSEQSSLYRVQEKGEQPVV